MQYGADPGGKRGGKGRLITLADAEDGHGRLDQSICHPYGPRERPARPPSASGGGHEPSRRRPASAMSLDGSCGMPLSRRLNSVLLAALDCTGVSCHDVIGPASGLRRSLPMPIRSRTAALAARVYNLSLPGASHVCHQPIVRAVCTTGRGWGMSGADGGRGSRPPSRPGSAPSARAAEGGISCSLGSSRWQDGTERPLRTSSACSSQRPAPPASGARLATSSSLNASRPRSAGASAEVLISPYLTRVHRAAVCREVFERQLQTIFALLAGQDGYMPAAAQQAALDALGLPLAFPQHDDGEECGWADFQAFQALVKRRGGKRLTATALSRAIGAIQAWLVAEERARNRRAREAYRAPLPRRRPLKRRANNNLSDVAMGVEIDAAGYGSMRAVGRIPWRRQGVPAGGRVSSRVVEGGGEKGGAEGTGSPAGKGSPVKFLGGHGEAVKWISVDGCPMWPGHWPEREEETEKKRGQREADFADFVEGGGVREHYEVLDQQEERWHSQLERIFLNDFWKDPTKNKVRVEAPPERPSPLSEQRRDALEASMEDLMDRTVFDPSGETVWDEERASASGSRKLACIEELAMALPPPVEESEREAVIQLGAEKARWLERELEGMGIIASPSKAAGRGG